MEENKELQELMARIDKSNRQQAKFAKWQCIFSAAAAICCLAVLVILLAVLPTLNGVVRQVNGVMADVEKVTTELARADWDGLVGDLEEVSRQMASADLGGIAQDVSGLVKASQTGLEDALEKLNAIDFDTLNNAIRDLSDVIEPLAKFANRFK